MPPLSNCVTVTPLLCVAAVVLLAPRVHPVISLPDIPVYVTCSPPICTVPVESSPVVEVNVNVATELEWEPFNVVDTTSSSWFAYSFCIYSL